MEDEQKIRIDASASSDQVFPEIVWENRFHDLSVVSTTAIYSRTRFLNAKYLKWMLAPLKNAERLRCCQGPVAYAHRQRSVALRATTKQPGAGLRREALI